jgi:cell division protein FtsA
MSEIFTTFDIGTYGIRAAIGRLDQKHGLSVLALAQEEVQNAIDQKGVAHIERLVSILQGVADRLQRQSSIVIQQAWVGITHAEMRTETANAIITFPRADHEVEWKDLVRLREQAICRPVPPGYRLIHAIPLWYRLDHRDQLSDPVGMSGIRLEGEYLLVYAPEPYLTTLHRCFERVGIQVQGFLVAPLMAAQALLTPEEKNTGVGYVDMGAHHTSVILYQKGQIKRLAILPLGGSLITQDIREMIRRILPPQAETLKKRLGLAFRPLLTQDQIISIQPDPRRPDTLEVRHSLLVEVIQARLQEIFEFVAHEIDKAGLLQDLHAGLYVAGGTACLAGLRELLEYTTGLSAHIVSPVQLIANGIVEPFQQPDLANLAAILDQAPKLHELTLYIPMDNSPSPPDTTSPTQDNKPKRKKIFEKMFSYMEKTFKLPSDLID